MKSKIKSVLTLALAIIFFAFQQANAATYPVTNLNDAGAGSLRQAILDANANPGADIIDATGVTGVITLMTGQLTISDALTLTGPGANLLKVGNGVIMAGEVKRVFFVGNVAVNISGITISDGRAIGYGSGGNFDGAGIYNIGQLNLTNCTISDNNIFGFLEFGSLGDGSGIYNTGILTVTNCIIKNNFASYEGDGGAGHGAGIANKGGTVTITNSTISDNTASSGGAGVYNTGSLSITNSTFSNNRASFGGGIFSFGELTLKNSTISGNRSSIGGGICYAGGPGSITNCTISKNDGIGGGIYNFTYETGGGSVPAAVFTIGNSIVAGNTNTADASKGADYFFLDAPVPALGYVNLTSLGYNIFGKVDPPHSLTFTGAGDQVGSYASPINPLLGPLANNGGPTCTHALPTNSPAMDKGSPTAGITTDQRGINRPVDNSSIANAAGGNASDIGAYESTVVNELTINDVTRNEGNSGTTTYSFKLNLSSPAGPGGVTFDIATASGIANTANNDYVAKSLISQLIPEGSSIYTFDVLVNGDNTIEPDETFFVNITNVNGADIRDGQGIGTILNDDCGTFTGNRAYVNSTASGINDGRSWPNAFTSLETALQAARSCGVTEIWVAKGTYYPTADPLGNTSSADPRDNTFFLANGVAIYGGFPNTGTPTMSDRQWRSNTTTLSGEIQQDNNAGNNAYHVVISLNNLSTNTRLDGFTVTGGYALGTGYLPYKDIGFERQYAGGIWMVNSSLRCENLIVKANRAVASGGIRVIDGLPTFNNLAILDNSATQTSGGMFVTSGDAAGIVSITNSVFAGNSEGLSLGMSMNLTNVVFYNNGVAVRNPGRTLNLVNCTFFNNAGAIFSINGSAVNDKNGIYYNNAGSNTTYNGVFLYDNTNTFNPTTSMTDGTNPKFVNPADPDGPDNIWMTADDGLAIQSTSPAINAGTLAGAPTTDIRGFSRAGNPDQGAYEYGVSGPTASVLNVNGVSTVCRGTSANLVVTITGGTSPYTVVYSDGTNNYMVNSYTSGTDIPVSPTVNTTYSLVSVTDAGANVGTGNIGTPTITVTDPPTWYLDADGDGYYVSSTQSCTSPGAGYTTTNGLPGDCNDDPNAGGAVIHAPVQYYVDADHDGFGSTSTEMVCSLTATIGYSTNNTDCDDANKDVWQSATLYIDVDGDGYDAGRKTVCYGAAIPVGYKATTLGSDCNDGNVAVYTNGNFYIDADGDTYGTGTLQPVCYNGTGTPVGYSTNNTDCNDGNVAIHAKVLYYVDGDRDGFGSTTTAMLCSLTAPFGYSTNNTDCNDGDVAVNSLQTYFRDADGDSYGSSTTSRVCSATAPAGFVTRTGDCNDNNASINPGAAEVCGNGIDDNCNGSVDEQPCFVCGVVTSLTTTNITSGSAQLNWTANANAVQWQVRYKTTNLGSKWVDVLLGGHLRTVTISSLLANQTYIWQIRAKCGNTWTGYSGSVQFKTLPLSASFVTNGRESKSPLLLEVIPSEIRVENFPNPFQQVTTIRYSLPMEARMKLTVLNALGQTIAVLVDGKQSAGTHQVNFSAAKHGAGMYHYNLQTINASGKAITLSGKMVSIK